MGGDHGGRSGRTRGGALALLAATLLACSSTTSTSGPATTAGGSAPGGSAVGTAAAAGTGGQLRLDQVQLLGTHNSYHRRMPAAFRDKLEGAIPGITKDWDYELPPLEEQLAEGVRQFEIDVHLDPDGRFAAHSARPWAGLPPVTGPGWAEPGLKVLHQQEYDDESHCLTFVACLTALEAWSDAHPRHVPILVLVEAKTAELGDIFQAGMPPPLAWDASNIGQIDDEIRQVFDEERLLTPDDVRGSSATLEEAVLAHRWPTIDESRGRFLFALIDQDLREAYASGHPSLEGRVMFANGPTGAPESAYVTVNNPKEDPERIRDLVRRGYLVRTNTDPEDVMRGVDDTSRRDAALASGAQWISTNYPVPDPTVNPTYQVTIPGGTPGRCNPVTAPPGCTATALE